LFRRRSMAVSRSRLPSLPALRDFIQMYRLSAKKVMSQNYLMDMNLTRKIARSAGNLTGCTVLEVGPGPGGITRAILESDCERLDVVEIDGRFLPALNHLAEASQGRLHVHKGNILKFNVEDLWRKTGIKRREWFDAMPDLHLIGNLPFNIATPLIIKCLRQIADRTGPWAFGRVPLTLTFQWEVASRISGPIDSPERSRLSIVSQYLTESKTLFRIPGKCFTPQPEIDVGVVQLIPRKDPLIKAPFEVVEKVARNLFRFRQKYIIKGVKTLFPKEWADEMAREILATCRISPSTTSIRLGVDEFADIVYVYEEQCRKHPGLFLFDDTQPHKQNMDELSRLPDAIPRRYPFGKRDLPSEGVSLADFGEFAV